MLKPLFLAFVWKFSGLTGPATGESIQLNGEDIPHPVWHAMVMPGEDVALGGPSDLRVMLDGTPLDAGASFEAPTEPGIYSLDLKSRSRGMSYDITLLVLEPSSNIDEDGRLNGYRIGEYPQNAPRGYIRLDEGYGDVNVSPSFRIGQFLCKQQPDHWPKYVLISSDNLKRLERLLAALKDDGITDADTFFVMSGYRTPFYNTAIGSAKLSRHMYGDATDIYVDVAPRDGVMDDLNRDGTLDKQDANFLYDYAQTLFGDDTSVPKGGLGSYDANALHGPFVHIDGRGRPARWGR